MKKLNWILIVFGIIMVIVAIICYKVGYLELFWAIFVGIGGGTVTTLKYIYDFFYRLVFSIDDLTPKYSYRNIKGRINILWIDNEISKFKEYKEYFNEGGYSIELQKDIKNIEDAKKYQIILCDIDGVGGKIAPDKKGNGFDVISKINEIFPSKFLIIVTGHIAKNILTILPTSIRHFMKENLSFPNFKIYLDNWIKDYLNPKYMWNNIFRPTLLKKSFSEQMIKKVEKAYIKDWKASGINEGNLEKSELHKLKNKGDFREYEREINAMIEYVIF